MSQIADLAGQVLAGQVKDPSGVGDGEGYCLKFARHMVDKALNINSYAIGPVGTDPAYENSQTASLAETAWIKAGLSVKGPILPGDLVFQKYFDPKTGHYPGHVGIVIQGSDGRAYVLENTLANRGQHTVIGAHTRLTPIELWDGVRTAIRFTQDKKSPSDKPFNVALLAPPAAGGYPGAAAPTNAVATPPAPTGPGFLAALLSDFPHAGLPDGPDYSKENPLWLYNTLEPYMDRRPVSVSTTIGVATGPLVIIRRPYSTEMDTAMPILGPLSISVLDWERHFISNWASLKSKYLTSESWGRTYQPIYDLGDPGNKDAYRWPVPFVTNVTCRQDAGTGALGEVELQISDPVEAEMIFATLASMQLYKNAIIEIWRPVFIHDDVNGGERQVVVPSMSGMIDEVVGSPYPHTIKFRVLPQDQFINLRGINPEEGGQTEFDSTKQLWEVVEAVGQQYNILFLTPSAVGLSNLPQLQRSVGESGFNTMGMGPVDVVRQVVERSGGLQMVPLFGTEIFGHKIFNLPFVPRAVYMIYDPDAFGPFTPGFWDNQLWSMFLGPIAKLLGRGINPVGEVAVLYPIDLGRDPKYVSHMADILRTYGSDTARANVFGKFVDITLVALNQIGVGSGTAVQSALEGNTQDSLINLLDSWWPGGIGKRVTHYFAPITSVEEFAVRTPTSTDLANPIFGNPGGNGSQRVVNLTAERAARLMRVSQSPDGSFQLTTPTGTQNFNKQESVMVYYDSSYGRPTMVVPATGDQQTNENPGKFFPYILTLQVKPSHGLRVGMPAAVIGIGRPDGMWEVQSIQWTLGRSDEQTVVLRTMRDVYFVA